MFGKKTRTHINIVNKIPMESNFWCNSAVLIEVIAGKGALKFKAQNVPDSYYGIRVLSALTLNGNPLMQRSLPICPTCAGLLATGYGIENIESPEIRSITAKINSNFSNIENAVNNISPLLELLKSGLYVIADTVSYPSDGNGHFFWNVPNSLTESPATAHALTDQYDCVGGIPVFLYPTQSTACLNEARVAHYKERFRENKTTFPRAIAYVCGEFVSALLDGHHKATAAALCGSEVPCLTIIPCSGVSYARANFGKMIIDRVHFGNIHLELSNFSKNQIASLTAQWSHLAKQKDESVTLNEYRLIDRDWCVPLAKSFSQYPDVLELAEAAALEITEISDDLIEHWIATLDEDAARKLNYAMLYFSRKDTGRAKKLALRCGRITHDEKLLHTAFTVLSIIKNDPDIEQFFIDHLVEDQDKHSQLKKIADEYWQEYPSASDSSSSSISHRE